MDNAIHLAGMNFTAREYFWWVVKCVVALMAIYFISR